LLVRESELDWDLPGGLLREAMGWRESLEDQIAELLDMQVVGSQPVYAADYIDPVSGDYTYTSVVLCDVFSNGYDDGNYTEVKWVDLADIPGLAFAAFDMKEAIISHFAK